MEPEEIHDYVTYSYVLVYHQNPPLAKRANPKIVCLRAHCKYCVNIDTSGQIKSDLTSTRFPHQNPCFLQESQPSLLSHLQNLWPTVCGTDQTHLPRNALWTLPWHLKQGSHETPRRPFPPPQPHSWHNTGHESYPAVQCSPRNAPQNWVRVDLPTSDYSSLPHSLNVMD